MMNIMEMKRQIQRRIRRKSKVKKLLNISFSCKLLFWYILFFMEIK